MNAIALKSLNPLTLPFVLIEQKHELPRKTGIYFVLSETGEILYIGKSIDIHDRWRRHHRYRDIKGTPVKIAWLLVEDSSLLHEIEMALIYWFKPKLNETTSNQVWVDRLDYLLNKPKTIPINKKLFCRLAVLMAEKNPQLSQRQLAKETGLDITIVNRLYTNNFSRVDVSTVEVLCNYFSREVGELFEMRNPENWEKPSPPHPQPSDEDLAQLAEAKSTGRIKNYYCQPDGLWVVDTGSRCVDWCDF
ncbi:MAG: helix-turn-helix domain-containing protein [Brasilonema sp.]